MRESRSSGSVEGVMGGHDPYSDFCDVRMRVYLTVKGPGLDTMKASRQSENVLS
jgi:hypothetical protein